MLYIIQNNKEKYMYSVLVIREKIESFRLGVLGQESVKTFSPRG
jgi:hypothetical protein